MIYIVTSAEHGYTHDCIGKEPDAPPVQLKTYADVAVGASAPPGTYVLTDFDRLATSQLVTAAGFARWHRRRGGRVLNNPARVLSRSGLLRILKRKGVNMFDAYRVEECLKPKRWPVFLRSEGNHAPPVSHLLGTQQELTDAIQRAIDFGVPLTTLLIVEYAAEPVRPGLFRKLSVFRIGEQLLGYTCVHDDQWVVKQGKPGIAPLELYEEEYRFVRDNPFAEAVRPAFELAGIDYGRVDFGIVDGRPQIYEINTNPELKLRPPPSTIARRDESNALFRRNYLEALRAIDSG